MTFGFDEEAIYQDADIEMREMELAARERETGICIYCDSAITKSPVDGAWEDSSGACGCGDGEHEPAGDNWTTRAIDEMRQASREE